MIGPRTPLISLDRAISIGYASTIAGRASNLTNGLMDIWMIFGNRTR
jgi:hypothetical protein